eukprot:jgi/Chrzof1/1011/Cz01g37020.t1
MLPSHTLACTLVEATLPWGNQQSEITHANSVAASGSATPAHNEALRGASEAELAQLMGDVQQQLQQRFVDPRPRSAPHVGDTSLLAGNVDPAYEADQRQHLQQLGYPTVVDQSADPATGHLPEDLLASLGGLSMAQEAAVVRVSRVQSC